ncbi:putative chromatin accessibility complex protein 1 [Monocercomonoides exilis]|uniref:putative chromatin accessibility complex protein 1 n=1 Tax=Monocercomonoides exilis TaxID=2049356 RepID=UPI003559AEB0|nr:putative chromatin accessibility complex protein 1 [Monocercomonoides exilis]|eukprot:MONOS_10545.1-p1 / transcript=MONOS_10545.1 / gene=MONOS_10545 / organism=Monocercomonoides_exilis_PA203 / gene_product=unspecified product / transcript_product=unspecified product / location=Mono_scaffold00483:38989-39644(+) / protein_length=133 / sequence_SO=supercontig / SO=protein_coding / is_pseudo=false
MEDIQQQEKIEVSNEEQEEQQASQKPIQFAQALIRRLMKQNPDVKLVQKSAIALVGKITEKFLEYTTREALESCKADGRRIIQPKDIGNVVYANPEYDFLIHVVPEPDFSNEKKTSRAKTVSNASKLKRTTAG